MACFTAVTLTKPTSHFLFSCAKTFSIIRPSLKGHMANTPNLPLLFDSILHHAREIEFNHKYALPGDALSEVGLPESVRTARNFHAEILGHGETGDVRLHRLSNDFGDGILLVAHHSESRWGVVEVYSLTGEIVASGVYAVLAFVWCNLEQARQASQNLSMPFHLFPKTASLEWIEHGTGDGVAYETVGGRFLIIPPFPYGDGDAFVLRDGTTYTEYPFANPDDAKAHAQILQSSS